MICRGVEVALFPMEVCRITQGDKTGTHYGNATDLGGKDSGICTAYAPFTCKVVSINKNDGNAIWFQSVDKVRTPKGTQYVHMMLLHDNNIDDLPMGKIIKQGEKLYDEGTAGKATGNHIHIEFAFGVLDVKKRYGSAVKGGTTYYFLPNAVSIEHVCYMNDTPILAGKADWETYTAPKADQIVTKGSKIEIPGEFRVDAIDVKRQAIGCKQLTGSITREYHWIPSKALKEVGGDQVLNVGERFTIPGEHIVLLVDKPTKSVKIKLGGKDIWVFAAPLYELED